MDKVRIDKWLWAARFYKTRSLATEEVHKGHVQVNGADVKASREIRVGDSVVLLQAKVPRTVNVTGLSGQRGSATAAALLYEETEESKQLREATAERRRLSPEPALSIEGGRPTKRDRRDLQKGWGDRWSASVDK
ncbi:RNA-binding protein [Rhodoferax lacus]|uniref:RNA-binding protein n=1 Tax=Rhodoferax lacus TaxID=2184758 RepID=A0A3E1RGP0_9BURK|nr:RNA-binding S4 domain-containing protein [Rhodoferax lacus]RFO98423.1 RNA-binding protein [Rhodoferax lacus]